MSDSFLEVAEQRLGSAYSEVADGKQIDPFTILMLLSLAVSIARCYLEWRRQREEEDRVPVGGFRDLPFTPRQRLALRLELRRQKVPVEAWDDFTKILLKVGGQSSVAEIEGFLEETHGIGASFE